ncbi:MAG: SRPBCC domain-containing protein [Hyphomicrobiales bacterium]|nr:SRPBCC domain-containing protein [Hyphomicrobiales bacterium]
MSILTTTAAIAATALVAAYGIGQITGPSISTEIEIAAPASVVWAELADSDAYAEWNPFVKHLSGDLEVGNRLNVTMQSEGNAPMDFTPEVLVADENEELRWVGRLGVKGIFDGEHYFILEETDRGTTVFRHGENFTGILGYPLLALIREDTLNGFLAMNAALKARVEEKV